MGDLTELFEVNKEQALRFFLRCLESEVAPNVAWDETLYVASILAHYAQTSRYSPDSMTPSGSLYEILDNFVLPGLTAEEASGLRDPEILEVAGSQTLLLVGFFRDQMKKTHNLSWYDQLGSMFFERASGHLPNGKKAYLLQKVAEHFPMWTISCQNMSRTLSEERYLLRV